MPMYYNMFYYYWDPTYILILIGVVLSLAASACVKSTYRKYSQVRSHTGMTGKEVAERILRRNGVQGVTVRKVAGELTDHYDPRSQTVNLSSAVYDSTSVAAIGVAAHECGHVLQHENGYTPLAIRGALVPVVNFGSQISWPLIIFGFIMTNSLPEWGNILLYAGILLFAAAVLFQLVTLPVEFNASARALKILESDGILYGEELGGTKKVLRAAAMTYVAGALGSLLQLIRILAISSRRTGRGRDV